MDRLRLERARPADRQLQRDRHGGQARLAWDGRSRAARWRSWTTRGMRWRTTWSATSAMQPHPEGYYSLGYRDDPERTRALYRGPWMTSGDLARRDSDGYFWFEGRADDVIKSAGYRIGPFEVESALLAHPAVAEAAVVGVPDALRGHIVKAYVVLRPGAPPTPGSRTSSSTWSRPASAAISTRARSSSSTSCPRRRRARSSASCCGSGADRSRPAGAQPATQPYQRWLGAAPSSRYAIFIAAQVVLRDLVALGVDVDAEDARRVQPEDLLLHRRA